MIDYLLANKEWIFSGAGVSTILVLGGWLFRRSRSTSAAPPFGSQAPLRVEIIQPKVPIQEVPRRESEVARMVGRFNKVLDLMNESRTYGQYTIAGLAQLMKLHSVGELESVFHGTREPSFEFIDHFCDTFGVNRSWLIEGKETPYRSHAARHSDPTDYLDVIQKLAPIKIYFIRSASEVGEVFLLLKFADWKYAVVDQIWHISDHVGAGGRSQILGMYKLIMELKKRLLGSSCGGRILSEDRFGSLLEGTIFPGSVVDFPAQENPWWDDFVDVDHNYPIATNYESWYGLGFVAAQSIVLSALKEQARH